MTNMSHGIAPVTAYARDVNIEIVSDTMWPNGYIGKQYLSDAIEEIKIASMLTIPLKFNILRVPYLLEYNYDESDTWSETHIDRMNRNFGSSSSLYGSLGYNNCK